MAFFTLLGAAFSQRALGWPALTLAVIALPQLQTKGESPLEKEIVASHALLDQERIVRKAVGSGNLDQCALAFKKLAIDTKESRFTYGAMRSYFHMQIMMSILPRARSGEVKARDWTGVPDLALAVPKAFPRNATALAGYYWWLRLVNVREPGMGPPKIQYKWETIQIGGRPTKVKVIEKVVHPDKDHRLAELFAKMQAIDNTDSMVLQIAAIRAAKDPPKSYALMKKAYDRGGKDLFPEQALYYLYDMARKMKDEALAEGHKSELLKWLRANKTSAWTQFFYFQHPDFPR
jgi:hypothetical protein